METIMTVASVKPPLPGKKQASVIDTQGNRWGVWADKLAAYNAGHTYKIISFTENEYQGKIFKTITKAEPMGGAPAGYPAASPTSVSVAASYSTADAKANQNATRRDIFICGAFNNIMANGNVNPLIMDEKDFMLIIRRLDHAWKNAVNNPQRRSDMDEEIPL